LYDHCCARDEKHAKGENEYWPFTKFTPTNEGWKIERREANTKQNELKFVGTINP
jgi:glutathione peroxidase-family protein